MQTNTLSVEIFKPVGVVFEATVNPQNTAKWVPFILEEVASEYPPKIGTVYSQRVKEADAGESRSSIVLIGLIPNQFLGFHSTNGKYACYYYYNQTPAGTLLTYSEDAGEGETLVAPFTAEIMQTLKKLIESQA